MPEPVVVAPPPGAVLRALGVAAVLLGATVIGWTVIVAALDPSWVRTILAVVLVLLGTVAAVLLVNGAVRLLGKGPRLVLEADRFVNHSGWASGVRSAAWGDVVKVHEERADLVLTLADGRTSRIRTAAIGADASALVRELRDRLNKGHGYRPVR